MKWFVLVATLLVSFSAPAKTIHLRSMDGAISGACAYYILDLGELEVSLQFCSEDGEQTMLRTISFVAIGDKVESLSEKSIMMDDNSSNLETVFRFTDRNYSPIAGGKKRVVYTGYTSSAVVYPFLDERVENIYFTYGDQSYRFGLDDNDKEEIKMVFGLE